MADGRRWFCTGSTARNGHTPLSGLTLGISGNLYGTTTYGGICNSCGTVFELTRSASSQWTEKVIYKFNIKNGSLAGSTPIFDAAGRLYGNTNQGGAYGWGTIFRLSHGVHDMWTEEVLHNFCSAPKCADGSYPTGPLIFDAAGNLYGTTAGGGAHDGGVVFEIGDQHSVR
jgi:uncharacterized repeat protein (TIGR03803 family)